MEELIKRYAKLMRTKVLKIRESAERKNSTVFVLASGQKLDMTEAEIRLEIVKLERKDEETEAGTVADGAIPPPPASSEPRKARKTKQEKEQDHE